MSTNDLESAEKPPTDVPRRRPRLLLGTFWMVFALIALGLGIAGGSVWVVLIGLAAVGYSIYLYRGGRYGFWFLPF